MRVTAVVIALMTWSASVGAATRVLTIQMDVRAPIEKAWNAWTTPEGVRTFFAPGCRVEPRVDGAYEIFFAPDAKPGERGAEDMRILALEPMRRFAFTWNAPPTIPNIRGQRTMVVLEFEAAANGHTRVRFTHLGWGEGKSWDQAYDYFDRAWNERVLPRFVHAVENGPVDWSTVPDLHPVARSLKASLTQPAGR